MEKTQSYIGIKNGVVLCVDTYDGYDFHGRFYHGYSREAVPFSTGLRFLWELEDFFEYLNFPFPATNDRRFDAYKRAYHKQEERIRVMDDKEMLMQHGDAGTFIIRVQQKQNSSWQGRITWVDEDKTVYFRSVWEMMKLIDSALQGDENEDKAEWDK